MPVTVTAKRALRSSSRKATVNALIISKLEVAIRQAKKVKTKETVLKAQSLADVAAKKNVIHKNKASRIKSNLSKLVKLTTATKKTVKKASKKK